MVYGRVDGIRRRVLCPNSPVWQVCLAAETCGHFRFDTRHDMWYSSESFKCKAGPAEEVSFADLVRKVWGEGSANEGVEARLLETCGMCVLSSSGSISVEWHTSRNRAADVEQGQGRPSKGAAVMDTCEGTRQTRGRVFFTGTQMGFAHLSAVSWCLIFITKVKVRNKTPTLSPILLEMVAINNNNKMYSLILLARKDATKGPMVVCSFRLSLTQPVLMLILMLICECWGAQQMGRKSRGSWNWDRA